MDKSPGGHDRAGHIERATLLFGSATNSIHDAPRTAVANQNANAYNIAGSVGTLINSNPANNYIFHGELPKLSDPVQAKISEILASRHVVRAVYGAQIEKGCMKGTRVQVLLEIEAWIKDLKGPQIFWLAGMAGMGKSAIAWTVCSTSSMDPNIILAGSFFCSRSTGITGQRDVRCVVPTLAQLLALQSAKFAEALAAELMANPGVLDQQVGVQVEKLLYKPVFALKDSPVPIVFVIDALDECGGQLTDNGTLDDAETHRIVSDMLEALVTFSNSEVKLPVKFFVTSRPETHIRDTHISDVAFSKVLRLHTIDKQQITADIRFYITSRLLATPILRSLFTKDDVNSLSQLCDDLFIVASTVLEHALSGGPDVAQTRFKLLLDVSGDRLNVGVTGRLDRMYAVIVEEAAKDDEVATDKLDALLQILAALLSARMTLSITALADLLGISSGQLRARMTRLHAVIHVPDDDYAPGLRPIHASFGDYLFGRASSHIRIPESLGHKVLTDGCFHIMSKHLHFNISHSQSSFETNPTLKPNSVMLSLEYACLQWIYHVSALIETSSAETRPRSGFRSRIFSRVQRTPRSSQQAYCDETIASFFRPKLLFWLEVMSVLGYVQRAVAMLMFAVATVQAQELSRFLRDANSFVASSQEAIARSAPHIYLSALPFADTSSLVYQQFAPLCTGLISVDLIGVSHHAGRQVMTLTGHEGSVNSVAYSPNGRLLASASADGTVRIWDMRTGEEKMTPLRSEDGAVMSIAFHPNSQSVVSGTDGGSVCVWSLMAAHVATKRLQGHSGTVLAVAVSPSGSRIASASADHNVCLWNAETSQKVWVLTAHTGAVHALAFTSDSLALASGSDDGTILLWDVTKGKLKTQSQHRHQQPIHGLCFLSDGQKLVACCGKELILCKPRTGKRTALLHSASTSVLSASPPSGGPLLLSVSGRSVCLTTVPRFVGKPSTVVLDGHTEIIRSSTFSPSDLYIASASDDCTIRIWNAGSEVKVQPTAACDAKANEAVSALIMSDSRELKGHSKGVQSLAVSPDGAFIVSGSDDKSVRVWNAQTSAALLQPLLRHTDTVRSVDISSDGRLIASGSFDHTVRLWDAQIGKVIGEPLTGHSLAVIAVVFSPDALWLASGSNDKTVHIWDVTAWRSASVGPFRCVNCVWALAFSPDGRLVAAGDRSGYISIWEMETGQPARQPLKTSLDHVRSICFSPDGTRIVAGGEHSESEYVQIWNVSTGQQVLTLTGHTGRAWAVVYSRDGRFIGTGSEDRTVRLWDATTGAPIAVLNKHSSTVGPVAFTPNGRSIVSGSNDMTIRIWDITEAYRERSASDDDPVTVLHFSSLYNGWLRAPSGELLLWVPMEYRRYLHTINGRQRVHILVEKEGWHRGKSWTSCWRGHGSGLASRPT